jgi:hypothetical protein
MNPVRPATTVLLFGDKVLLNRNHNWRDVPLPALMRDLERDARGLPIPYIVQRDNDGKPHFTINDAGKGMQALAKDLCPICGNKLFRGRWFVGGPLSAFHPDGCYFDTPMHADCMRYALRVCPYLAAPKYVHRLDGLTADPNNFPEGVVGFQDNTVIPDRPEIFVAVMAIGQEFTGGATASRPYLKPKKVVRYEYWLKGERLPEDEGFAISQRVLAAAPDRRSV